MPGIRMSTTRSLPSRGRRKGGGIVVWRLPIADDANRE